MGPSSLQIRDIEMLDDIGGKLKLQQEEGKKQCLRITLRHYQAYDKFNNCPK